MAFKSSPRDKAMRNKCLSQGHYCYGKRIWTNNPFSKSVGFNHGAITAPDKLSGNEGDPIFCKRLTLSWPISLHSHKPPGPHCFEPFTCNVYRSFQPQNMHMCKQFLGKVSTAKMFFENQTYLWFVWFFLQNENELKIKEIFLPWKAKHTGKIVAP